MTKTGINWASDVWNPTRGCSRTCAGGTKQSGCGDGTGGGCYAEAMAGRIVRMGRGGATPYDGLVRETPTGWRWTGRVAFDVKTLAAPLRWRKPRRIFVDSMSDLFHDGFPNEQIAAVFGVMAACPQHTFLVLTKRSRRMREWFEWVAGEAARRDTSPDFICQQEALRLNAPIRLHSVKGTIKQYPWPLANVHLGVSVENQEAADERVDDLRACPAAVRWISGEPLLGRVDLHRYLLGDAIERPARCACGHGHGFTRCPNTGGIAKPCHHDGCACSGFTRPAGSEGIHWVVAGCESGPNARPCDVAWLRSLRDQCKRAGVPFWLKQAKHVASESGTYGLITLGIGSRFKPGGIIDLPYLDGVQHAELPTCAGHDE